MKTYKHKNNGSTMTYKEGCMRVENLVIEGEPDLDYWEEIVEYPIGTKVHNSQTNTIYTKKEDGWYKPSEKTTYTNEMIGSKKHLTVLGTIEKGYEKQ
tara:strand:- start:157 stop:450 length:294 start_codon:yes stop_codon:yes gene_type:complete